jgi:nickel-dependent lactate racemase
MGMEPLHELLKPGMKLTIAFDDLSCRCPPMQTAGRQAARDREGLEKAHAKGVEDIHIIAALGLHRRMTEGELRHCLGDRIMSRYYPDRLYNYDAEDEEAHVNIGETDRGEEVTISRRVAEGDLLVYVNINYIPMDGGHKSVHTGLSPYSSIRHHHNPDTLSASRSLMDPPNSAMHGSINRMGALLDEHVKVFHIETTLNNSAFRPSSTLWRSPSKTGTP